MPKNPPDELPPNLHAVLRAAKRNGVHKCVTPAADRLSEYGLVDIVSLSKSGLTCEIMPTDLGRKYGT